MVFVCAKAKRQQQQNVFLCESVASATWFSSVRKRSVSNNMFFLCESEA
ncbi:hypothetical protein [Lysinibacillus sp. fls2-241-R2A-57]|nr:hypothetical protein [Lysinibacillus sp. fls2-241-R2A-57]